MVSKSEVMQEVAEQMGVPFVDVKLPQGFRFVDTYMWTAREVCAVLSNVLLEATSVEEAHDIFVSVLGEYNKQTNGGE